MYLFSLLPILIFLGIIFYLIYMGLFLPIPIEENKIGPFNFLFKEAQESNYSQVGKLTEEIHNILKNYNFSNQSPLQIFYPKEENKILLVGFTVSERVTDIIGLNYKEIPEMKCLTASFPWRNNLSFIFGFMKVEPSLKAYRKSKNYKDTEILVKLENDTIYYMQRILN